MCSMVTWLQKILSSNNKKYDFQKFCSNNEVPSLPPIACVVAIFLCMKIQSGESDAVLMSFFYAILSGSGISIAVIMRVTKS